MQHACGHEIRDRHEKGGYEDGEHGVRRPGAGQRAVGRSQKRSHAQPYEDRGRCGCPQTTVGRDDATAVQIGQVPSDERDHHRRAAQLTEHGAHRGPGHPVIRRCQCVGRQADDGRDDAHDGIGYEQPLRVRVGQHDALGREPDALEDDAHRQHRQDRARGRRLGQGQRGDEELERRRGQGSDARGEQDGEHRYAAQAQ